MAKRKARGPRPHSFRNKLLDKDGNDIFAGAFTYLARAMNGGETAPSTGTFSPGCSTMPLAASCHWIASRVNQANLLYKKS